MSGPAELQAYFDEAASWDADRVAQHRRTARIAWWTAGGGWFCAIACAVALTLLTPLKRVDPFLIRVDNATGIVDVVPIYTGIDTQDTKATEAITRYLLTHYVTTCERFNFATAESDYEECGAFHTAQRNQAWYTQWNPTSATSPLNVHKDGSTVRAQVKSLSFFQRASGVADLAHVRYVKGQRAAGGTDEQLTHWIATIQYTYATPSADARTRRWNPLGFKIIDFKPEPEIQEASTRAPSTGHTP